MSRKPAWKKRAYSQFVYEGMHILSDTHEVVELSPYHFRIDGKIDLWPSSKKFMKNGRVGKYEKLEDIFV